MDQTTLVGIFFAGVITLLLIKYHFKLNYEKTKWEKYASLAELDETQPLPEKEEVLAAIQNLSNWHP